MTLIERVVVYQGVACLEELRRIEPRIRRMPPLRDPLKLDAAVDRCSTLCFRHPVVDPLQGVDRPLPRQGRQGLQRRARPARVNPTLPRRHPRRHRCDPTDYPLRMLRAIVLERRDQTMKAGRRRGVCIVARIGISYSITIRLSFNVFEQDPRLCSRPDDRDKGVPEWTDDIAHHAFRHHDRVFFSVFSTNLIVPTSPLVESANLSLPCT